MPQTTTDRRTYMELQKPRILTLGQLEYVASDYNFPRRPLIFINACESMTMSPLFYDGFVPYFIANGSAGVVGTVSWVPAIFASRFAIRFFEGFFQKESIDDIIARLRREFLAQNHNPLGLYYASYCNSNLSLA